jgi:outer membrane immunogenic protein
MRKLLIVGFALALLTIPAAAADMAPYYKAPRPLPVFSWTGCYIGGDVGGAWSSQDVSNTSPPIFNQAGVTGTLNASDVIGGGYVGCNYQWTPSLVVGIEGDFSGTHLLDTVIAPNLFASGAPVGSGGVGWASSLDWIATVRGRVGYVWAPNLLLFATGGGAWGKTNYASLDAFTGGCPNCGGTTFSTTSSGYVVGGGVDWAPWRNNWIVRVEYLYYNLSGTNSTAVFQSPFTGVVANPSWNNMSIQSARVGLSYKF